MKPPRVAPLSAGLSLLCTMAGGARPPQEADTYFIPHNLVRVALAVGVENYDEFDRVPNALNDMRAAGDALRAAGFAVTEEPNPTAHKLRTAIRHLAQISTELDRPAVVAVFFAGHGFQEGTDNFIVPKDAKKSALVDDSISIGSYIVPKLSAKSGGVMFLFLDACRTLNPLVNAVNPGDRPIPLQQGYAQGPSVAGAIQMFAAKWGQAALSRAAETSVNSPYSDALKRYLNVPGDNIGLTYSKVLARVKGQVEQEPELLTIASVATIRFMPLSKTSELEAEEQHWRMTLATARRECVKEFLTAYPDSRYTMAALKWIAETPRSPASIGEDECPQR